MITSIDTKKRFNKIQHPFIIKKALRNTNIEGKSPQLDKEHLPKAYS